MEVDALKLPIDFPSVAASLGTGKFGSQDQTLSLGACSHDLI